LIVDARSPEAELRSRVDVKWHTFKTWRASCPRVNPRNAQGLAANAEVAAGLRSLTGLGVTWLDANNRIDGAMRPNVYPEIVANAGEVVDSTGMSGSRYVASGWAYEKFSGSLFAVLRRCDVARAWWMARKYEVQLIDASEQDNRIVG